MATSWARLAVAGSLKLAYSQFEELEAFAKFGTHLDDATRKTIEHGQRIRACLKQAQSQPVPVVVQIVVLVALQAGLFDKVPLEKVAEGEAALRKSVSGLPTDFADRLNSNEKLSDGDRKAIVDLAHGALDSLQPKAASGKPKP